VEAEKIKDKISAIVDRLAPLTAQSPPDHPPDSSDPGDIPLDSVAMLQLVVAIEDEFGVTFEDNDIGPENLRDLASLCRFVESKLRR
jgi:acyl carrier protein